MDINVVRGVLLVMLIIAFVGLIIWAWSGKRKADFEKAARLPLEEDFGRVPEGKGREESSC